ncbi:MAG: PAS domain S-box protein [Desulfosalsimonadaceae bacterium]|nr:PAS domain S-box protein [Desulfosalsimonadaceae bacterium]
MVKNKEKERLAILVAERTKELEAQLTERKRTEEALRESEERFRLHFENAPLPSQSLDADGNIIAVNNAWLKTLGYSREEVLGQWFGNFLPGDYQDIFRERFPRFKKMGEIFGAEFEMVDRAGLIRIVSFDGRIGLNSDGSFRQTYCVFKDLTGIRLAQAALLEKEKEYQLLIENLSVGMVVYDPDTKILFSNPMASTLFGLTEDQMLGKTSADPVWCFLLEDKTPMPIPEYPVNRVLSSGKPFSNQVVGIRRPGLAEPAWVQCNAYPVNDAGGHLSRVVVTFSDITGRKRTEEALEKRLVALTRPLDDIEGVTFEELFNLDDIQRLQDEFAGATGVASIITHTDGTPITRPSSFCRLCSEIIRKTDKGRANCYRSDAVIGQLSAKGPAIQPCMSGGLWDAGAGISVGGRHIANWLIGQVRDETQTEENMRDYAREIGADETATVEAFREIPVMSRDKFGQVSQALFTLANQLSAGAYQNVQQARFITDRKRAEEALRESEQKHRLLFENAGDAIFIHNLEARILAANPAACKGLGYSQEELTAMTVYQVDSPEQAQHAPKRIAELMENGHLSFETLHQHKDGSLIPIEVNSRLISWDGQPAIMSICRDITDRKKAEEALRLSAVWHRTLVETIPDLVWLKDMNGVYLSCNHTFERFFGAKEADIVGRTDYDFKDKDLADFFREHDKKAIAAGGPSVNEEWLTFPDNGYLGLFETVKTPMRDVQGHLVGVLGIARDITARKRSEDALRESEERLRVALDATRIGIWDWNIEQDIWYASPKYYTMLGYEPETGPSDRTVWLDRVHPQDREFVASKIRQVLDGKDAHYEYEARMQHADGSYKWHRVLGNVIDRDEHGKATRMLGVRMDITEGKRAEEEREKMQAQLNQALKMESVGRLAGGVAHDFNNMLGIILGHTEMAMDQVDPVQPLYDDLVEIRKAAERSADLTRQLLAFARKQTVAPMVLDLNETVESMLKMLRRLIGEDIDLAWLPGPGMWPVKVDPTQIDQILANLCLNARDAIAGVGKVTIGTEKVVFDEAYCAENADVVPGEYVLLAVSDDGFGMDKETLGKLFEPFFTTKEMGKGTGLGLATVYGIVKQNNGFIKVYSEPGQGTTFKIYLPRYRGKSGQMQKEFAAEPISGGHETILLVEDEPAILKMTTMMLERMGYHVMAANTPGAAIRLAEAHPADIHLLMTDVVMPEMNGRDLAKNLLSLYPHLKRLFMSGYTANVIAHHGVLDEGVHFIQKPFTKKVLADMLREVLDSK